MPRLTNIEYLKRRKLVQALYDNGPYTQLILGQLKLERQQHLHYYYLTAETAKTDNELIEHRKWCNKNATLSSGKAFSQVHKSTIHLMKKVGIECDYINTAEVTKKIPELNRRLGKLVLENQRKKAQYKSNVKVVPVMRSKVDIDLLSRALIAVAKQMQLKS